MMNAVHPRSYNDQIQNAFESDRKPPVGMMKEGLGFKGEEKNKEHYRSNAENQDSKRKKPHRERNFTEVKSRGGADIHIQIGVVHVMESPEERNHVIGPMPPPVSVIHEQKCSGPSGPSGQSDPVYQPDMPILCPHPHRDRDWQHGETDDGETRNREHEIAHETMQRTEMLAAQRKAQLQTEQ